MKLLPSLFSCVYGRVKLFEYVMNGRRRSSIFVRFIYELEEKNSKSEVIFAVCRLPLNLSIKSLTLRQTANGKRQKWNFCRLSFAPWTVKWKHLYL